MINAGAIFFAVAAATDGRCRVNGLGSRSLQGDLRMVDVLEQIRLLSNLETASQKLLQIVLVGQPEARVQVRRLAENGRRGELGPVLQHVRADGLVDFLNQQYWKAVKTGT